MQLIRTITGAALLLAAGTSAWAATDYNRPPAGDAQYRQCLSYSATVYEGGSEPRPIKGQTKAQACARACGTKRPKISRATS